MLETIWPFGSSRLRRVAPSLPSLLPEEEGVESSAVVQQMCLRIAALLGESFVESCCFLLRPGSGEVIEVVMKFAAGGGPLPRRLFQHPNDRLVETQPVLARASPDGLLKLGGDVTQGYSGHRELPFRSSNGCITRCSTMQHITAPPPPPPPPPSGSSPLPHRAWPPPSILPL